MPDTPQYVEQRHNYEEITPPHVTVDIVSMSFEQIDDALDEAGLESAVREGVR